MSPHLSEIFQAAYAELRPRAPAPPMHIRFYPFVSINNTIRLRQSELYVRLSDLLEGAPGPILHAIAHILLAKLYRKPIDRAQNLRYRRYISSHDLAAKARLVRQLRGRKHIHTPRGHHYHLEEIFDDLNRRFFHGLMGRPQLTWSREHARNRLGHYDPAHNAIVISRVFDSQRVPRYVLEYIVYHEMLHLKHPVKLHGSRRCVHSREFMEEEKLFPELPQAKKFLRIV
ncbi:MAG TPA: SprT-like domain-containing protein [Terriglobales bacterium]|nr:SprT-like domain-containing protein [Terriglobales bacterium]